METDYPKEQAGSKGWRDGRDGGHEENDRDTI